MNYTYENLPPNVQHCMRCLGSGRIMQSLTITPEGPVSESDECPWCEGSGLVEVTYKPYKKELNNEK